MRPYFFLGLEGTREGGQGTKNQLPIPNPPYPIVSSCYRVNQWGEDTAVCML
ncbi:MAG: hypothetical protein VKL59_06440 [Nostocaceae cyanobacterium]|nr:hypothetical protein [Nostocaceae cyanobacterium]